MEEMSAVFLLDQILSDAMEWRATDIHLYASEQQLTVQMRVSGGLVPYLEESLDGQRVVRRIKALARMDVAESRVPQDGSFQWELVGDEKLMHIRVASTPTIRGEAVVLRLLPHHASPLTLVNLGMTESQATQVNSTLASGTGLILVAGPTGAGKTTTLYAMMLQLSRWGRHVVSIEDPVEMPVAECRQLEVRESLGVTFHAGLRALLRHDPDVIMIGEIRDEETAATAVRAATTGHLILTTTHAKDWIGALARLNELRVSRSLLGEVLRLIISQTLITPSQSQGLTHRGQQIVGAPDATSLPRAQGRFTVHALSPAQSAVIAGSAPWATVRRLLGDLDTDVQGDGP